MNEGWIKIYFKMLEWEWMDDPYVVTLWLRILLNANLKERKWHGRTIRRGQWLTSVHHLAEQTGWSRNTIKRILRILEQSRQITTETDVHGMLITVVNFSKYQSKSGSNDDPQNKQSRSINDPQGDPLADPQGDPLADPNIRSKEVKKERIINIPPNARARGNDEENFTPREAFGVLHNVMLLPAEHRTLVEQFGEQATNTAIDELSCKLADGTFESRHHYATLTYWLNYHNNKTSTNKVSDQEDTARIAWAACTPQERIEYLETHGGKLPWEQ